MSAVSELDYVLSLLDPDPGRIEAGRRRQAAVWEGKEPDYAPIILPAVPVPEKRGRPGYNLRDQFYDPEKMLVAQAWELVGQARSAGDGQLCVRANLGAGFLASVFGLEQTVYEDKMPWLNGYLPKERLAAMSPAQLGEDGIRGSGLMPRALHYSSYFAEMLGAKAHVYVPDTQGPLDLAGQLCGSALFTELYDDPGFVHHVLELSTAAYVSATSLLKEAIGEGLDAGYHRWGIYMSGGGARCCEDVTTLISLAMFRGFAAPYTARALRPFGSGWVHFCGSGHQWLEALLSITEVRGVNLGNPERYDWESTLGLILARGRFYLGACPRLGGESLAAYFDRVLRPLRKRLTRCGLILVLRAGELPELTAPERVVDLWHAVQDQVL